MWIFDTFWCLTVKDGLDTLRQFAHDGGAVLLVTHDQRTADLADKEIRL